jgi:hypothetical protein
VWRSGDRKRELVDFSGGPRFQGAFREAFQHRFSEATAVGEEQFINFLDFFVLQHRLPDRSTVVERFVAEHPQLPEEERAMLLGWQDVVEGVFQVGRRDRDGLVAVNLVDDLTYRVRSNQGPASLDSMRRGMFLITRLVPIGEDWLLSGASTVLPKASRGEAYRLAAELAARHPALVFRNPERLEHGRQRQGAGYWESPTISPLAFRRLAEPDPARANRVFRRVLRRPEFSWERDGEALLRQYKASWFERPALPSVTPISKALSDHHQGARRPSSGRKRR